MRSHTSHIFSLTSSAILLAYAGLAGAQTQNTLERPHADHMRAKWQQADLDKDGQISKAEAQAAGMKHLSDNFDAIDSNKDGKISETELRTFMQAKRAVHQSNADKRADKSVPAQPDSARAAEKGGMAYKSPDQRRADMQERFNKADTNKDGGLSRAELQAAGVMPRVLENFDAIDANKDGKITPEELRAAWERRSQ